MPVITNEDSRKFERDKTLYHYTSLNIALEHIFPTSKLRLSPLTSASDPMEKTAPTPSVSTYGDPNETAQLEKEYDGFKIAKQINRHYKNLKQLCLCRNSDDKIEGHYGGVFQPIDHFGFAKPRMWDQYGENFKGVCIALSREKLESQLSDDERIINIKYSKTARFKPNIDNSSVDLNRIKEVGEEEYIRNKKETEYKKIRRKHIDYQDENECKIITASESEFTFIDIKNCIQGIFITNIQHYTYAPLLKKIATDYKVPLFTVNIKRTGIKVYPLQTEE